MYKLVDYTHPEVRYNRCKEESLTKLGKELAMIKEGIIIALAISYLLDRQVARRKSRAKAKKPELENIKLERKLKRKR